MSNDQQITPIEHIASRIYMIRGERVMLDSDLADLYGVLTKRLNEQVKRNLDRFPEEFAFQLTQDEYDNLRSQNATSSSTHGGRRVLPWVFSEHGTLMLSSVLKTEQATQISISIIKAFVCLREMLATHKDVARKIEEHDKQIASLYKHVERLLRVPANDKKPIGYIWDED